MEDSIDAFGGTARLLDRGSRCVGAIVVAEPTLRRWQQANRHCRYRHLAINVYFLQQESWRHTLDQRTDTPPGTSECLS
jgi:hypothetical protein